MPRPIPQNRDRLGLLSQVFTGAGATDTDAEYAIGTSDALVHVVGKPEQTTDETLCYLMNLDDATNFRMGIRYSDDKPFIEIGANTYVSDTAISPSPWGRVVDLWAMLDRSASCYFLCDRATCGDIDISADVATDITSDTMEIGGRLVATEGWSGVVLCAQQFVLSGSFPTAAQRLAIADQQYADPGTLGATLSSVAAAADRRLLVDFVDLDQDGTTVTNDGTGGALTIGGGFEWRDVRTQAERVSITLPEEDWYCFDSTHQAAATADISCVQGSYIAELVYKDIDYAPGLSAARLFYMFNAGATERIYFDITAPAYSLICTTNSVAHVENMQHTGYSKYGVCGLHVMHFVYDADGNEYNPFVNGQKIGTASPVADLNLSGNVSTQFGINTRNDGVMALRLWNAASLTAGWATEILDRVHNPWQVTGAFSTMTLRANYECRIDVSIAQPVGGTLLKNIVNPGTGDLTISGGGTLGNSTTLAIRGTG